MDMPKKKTGFRIFRNDRGIALLVVLLVTALLIALIFEFAYGTRISLNNAVNFRDSQRAYYLARSGIYAFIKYGDQLRQYTPQGQWGVVPLITDGDTEVRFKYEDETGKIKVTDINNLATQSMLNRLFENKNIDTDVLKRMVESASDVNTLSVLSGLRQYMSDEDFIKVKDFLTLSVASSHKININAASKDVLQSLGIDQGAAELIVQRDRLNNPFTSLSDVPGIGNNQIRGQNLSNYLTVTAGTIYTVSAYATVGGYTKQIDAVVNGTNITFWRAL